jgi:hypothetical protein
MRQVDVDIDDAFLRTPLRLSDPEGRGLSLPPGPPMLAFVRGVLDQHGWTWGERLRLLRAAAGWGWRGFRCPDGMNVAELTATLPAAPRRDVVDPLCIAALNTPAREASASVFLRVIHDALFSGPGSADLLLPRRRLSELFPTPAAAWLARSGATLRVARRVERLARHDGRWRIDDAEFDLAVLATTAVEASRLVRSIDPEWAALAGALRYEPIVTVYAQSDATQLPHPMLALHADDDRHPAQFVFDHGQLGGRPGVLAFVISGAAGWLGRGLDVTRRATLEQARTQLGALLATPLRHLRDLTEKRATFRCVPALKRPRAGIEPGLRAAGDYVMGPYPATLEGAVRSGVAAVRRSPS